MLDLHNLMMPEVTLRVELDTSLQPILDATLPLHAVVQDELTQALENLLHVLGIPGAPAVTLAELPAHVLSSQFLRLSVNGHRCRYGDELPGWVLSYVQGDSRIAAEQPDAVLERLRTLAKDSAPEIVEFLALATIEILKGQLSLLLDVQQVAAYIAALPLPSSETLGSKAGLLDPTVLLPVLRTVLEQRISLADRQSVMYTLLRAENRAQADLAEDLITTLAPTIVEVRLPRAYLRELTLAAPVDKGQLFPVLRDNLFEELGLVYPSFHWVIADELKPRSWCFTIGHLPTLPVVGPAPNQILVNDSPERLDLMGLTAIHAVNPATNRVNGLVDAAHQDRVLGIGRTAWTLPEYLGLSLAASLRRHGATFVHRRSVEVSLAELDKAFPAIVKAVNALLPIERIIRVLRLLAAEQVSIRNLRRILQRLTEYAEATPTMEDLPDLVATVRMGLARELGYKLSQSMGTVPVYLFTSEIEQLLQLAAAESSDGLTEDMRDSMFDRVAAAIRTELRILPPRSLVPVLLVTMSARPQLRTLAALEFPHIAVAAYEDLPLHMNVQPIARIALET